jgi:hypothetical protein
MVGVVVEEMPSPVRHFIFCSICNKRLISRTFRTRNDLKEFGDFTCHHLHYGRPVCIMMVCDVCHTKIHLGDLGRYQPIDSMFKETELEAEPEDIFSRFGLGVECFTREYLERQIDWIGHDFWVRPEGLRSLSTPLSGQDKTKEAL